MREKTRVWVVIVTLALVAMLAACGPTPSTGGGGDSGGNTGGGDTSPSPTPEPASQSFTWAGSDLYDFSLTFEYPEGWSAIGGGDDVVINNSTQPFDVGSRALDDGEIVVMLLPTRVEELTLVSDRFEVDAAATDVLEVFLSLGGGGTMVPNVGVPEVTTIGDYPGAVAMGTPDDNGLHGMAVAVELVEDDVFVVIPVLASTGDAEALSNITMDIAASLEYAPNN